ncbi:hypothetical protein PQJ75_09970 [Rhodoplanes sp. TEM]|uniref:Uncharacterized protein n=1 Tax=Rhodoplanes tepidamans TaxID=200616 RepID=A0ABT5J830_RHOTP|nr:MULTISPECIES: hypothetical protein [Rhodoplanes]MDC7785789.1 hypothetical protein [Rhodoplanes tepidamans]MDC7984056.1 hypothetical protein [Rhodoplanes sp. TEM]MDQ0354648.1 hypothetical protein [Rhodoplanes tepidamans]
MTTPFLGHDSSGRSPLTAAVSTVGILVRYSFYLVGALVLGLIGLAILRVSSYQLTRTEDAAAFRVAVPSLDRLGTRGMVVASRGIGRVDLRQYGQVHGRDQDLTVALVLPPANWLGETDIPREISSMPVPRQVSGRFGQSFWDLETRFGEVRAVDAVFYADGLRKQCLAFLSRFTTSAVYLKGWYCEADGARPSPHHVACLLDGLVPERPLPSREADAFVRAGAARGPVCAAAPVVQTSDPRGPDPAVARKASPYAPRRNY